MKLLFDQNISHQLVESLSAVYPDSSHVRSVGLERADDETVWAFARNHGFTIVSKDSDFHQRSFLYGSPPKVIWLKVGNCSTKSIEELLRRSVSAIRKFCGDTEHAFMVLSVDKSTPRPVPE